MLSNSTIKQKASVVSSTPPCEEENMFVFSIHTTRCKLKGNSSDVVE